MANPSQAHQAATAAKVAQAWRSGLLDAGARAAAEALFRAVVAKAAVAVRAALADALKDEPSLPHDVALRLARDVDVVALPVLEASTVLTDKDLLALIIEATPAGISAMAGRAQVSAPVADAIANHGDETAVARLVANPGAEIAEPTFDLVLERHGLSDEVAQPLSRRAGLPAGVAEKLVHVVAEQLRRHLLSSDTLPADVTADLILQSRERATLGLAHGAGVNLEDLMDDIARSGRLTPTLILRALLTGDQLFFETALARRAGVSVDSAHLLIHDPGGMGLARLFTAAGMPETQLPLVRVALIAAAETELCDEPGANRRYRELIVERILTGFGDRVDTESVDYMITKIGGAGFSRRAREHRQPGELMASSSVPASSLLRFDDRGGGLHAEVSGRWVVALAQSIEDALDTLPQPGGRDLEIDMSRVEAIDTVGAWLLHRTAARWQKTGGKARITGASQDQEILLNQVAKADRPQPPAPRRLGLITGFIDGFGRSVSQGSGDFVRLVSFLGATVSALFRLAFIHPGRFRLTSTFAQMQAVGIEAMPIVGLISFLIGVVIAYQGVEQLQMFGAEIFVVNLIAISILRELGILLTSIVIAGRSGSSFTAQIGSMKLNEEVDAMRTLGLDPVEVLVVPRVLALVIMLPCLTFFSDMMGLLGGMVMAWITLGISPELFVSRLAEAVTWKTFFVGIIKAPFFAVTIAIVGCMEGLQVEGSSESVGRRTTESVVKAIFLVIVLDAVFSIFFAAIGI